MERVERQARELEERLARLATSIVPPAAGAAVIDPEATQMHQGSMAGPVGSGSLSGGTVHERSAPLSVPIPAASPTRPKSNSTLLIGGVVLIVLLIGGVIGAYFLLRTKPVTTGGAGPTPTPLASPGATDAIKADLVEIPGGSFQMGRNDGPAAEAPVHPETVQSFFMDRTEVTNAEYADFIRETHHAPPQDWNNNTKPPHGTEQWPVVFVSVEDVDAFASWRSKRKQTYRLPTEQEGVCRSQRRPQRSYPWGNEWKDKQAWLKDTSPTSVTYPGGRNKWGVLIGNA